ncbi:MAG: hypothetical protein JWN04_4597 [Myxococcaceae bacterium]|nr:hypothetical protein [Myxococcaceae bacterium]
MKVSIAAVLICMAGCGSNSALEPQADAAVDPSKPAGQGDGGNGGGTLHMGSDAAAHPDASDGPQTMLPPGSVVSGTYEVDAGLPVLPRLENVTATVTGDSANIRFLPVDGALDYRVYVLPSPSDVHVEGEVVYVQGATYRCAGNREVPVVDVDDKPKGENLGVRTLVDGVDVDGYTRSLQEAVLGYVYYAAAEDRVPVYALGDPAPKSDNWSYLARFTSTRTKFYTTSSDERAQRLAAGWRDDGISFYVPKASASGTKQIYTSLGSDGHTRYYFTDGAEKKVRPAPQAAFPVLSASAEGTQPLYRVFMTKYEASSHDELVYGKTWFNRVRYQGTNQPVTELHWSGLTPSSTLVVEALDSVCPYPGRLAAVSIPAMTTTNAATTSGMVMYPAAITPEEARTKFAHGELFINGQGDGAQVPKAIARAYLRVEPQPSESFDFFDGFDVGAAPMAFHDVECGTPNHNCVNQYRELSDVYDINWHRIVTGQRAHGNLFGELWTRFADEAADTNGKLRITPLKKANVDDKSYLHATMEVTSISTGRRYPQILISDRSAPIQDVLDQGNTVLLEVFRNWPNYLELQVCDHRPWDVNNQCPFFQFYEQQDSARKVTGLAPVEEMGELTSNDVRTRFDLFLSTKRAYVLVNRKPYGCVDLPASGIPRGPVTVTWGDVLYHSDADSPYGFHAKHQQYDTERHFDNLGFSSGVAEPAWNHDILPCVPASAIDEHP